MKTEYLIITGIGVILFLFSYNLRNSYIETAFAWILGITLVYIGIKLENESKKKSNKK